MQLIILIATLNLLNAYTTKLNTIKMPYFMEELKIIRTSLESIKRNTLSEQHKKIRTNDPELWVGNAGFYSSTFIPLDNGIAISNENSGQSTGIATNNTVIDFYDGSGTWVDDKGINFFVDNSNHPAPPGLFTDVQGFFDPRIIYDPEYDRFFFVVFYCKTADNSNSQIVIGVSNDGNPTPDLGWTFCSIPAPADTWYDFPNIGMSSSEFFITANKSTISTSTDIGTDIYQISKLDIISLSTSFNPIAVQKYDNVKDADNNITSGMCVVTNGAPQINGNFPYYGPGIYLCSIDFSNSSLTPTKLTLYDIENDIGGPIVLQKYSHELPIQAGTPVDAFQLNTTITLKSGFPRIHSAFYLDNIIHFVATATKDVSINESAVYYVRFDVPTPASTTFLKIDPNSTVGNEEWYTYPSICHMGHTETDKSVAITYLASGNQYYPQIRCIHVDDNLIPSNQVKFRIGDNFLIGGTSSSRWGDYTGIQRVYDAPCPRFWTNGTFGTSGNAYGSFAAQSRCGSMDVYNNELDIKFDLYPNPFTSVLNLEFTSENSNNINVELINMVGQVVYENKHQIDYGFNKLRLELPKLKEGMYSLILNKDHDKVFRKVLKVD
jgi:hypothetical protein